MELDQEGEGVAVANTCVFEADVVLEFHFAVQQGLVPRLHPILHLQQ